MLPICTSSGSKMFLLEVSFFSFFPPFFLTLFLHFSDLHTPLSGFDIGNQTLLTINRRGKNMRLEVSFDGGMATLFKETRNLKWLGFDISFDLTLLARKVKDVYPIAVSLTEIIRTYSEMEARLVDEVFSFSFLFFSFLFFSFLFFSFLFFSFLFFSFLFSNPSIFLFPFLFSSFFPSGSPFDQLVQERCAVPHQQRVRN